MLITIISISGPKFHNVEEKVQLKNEFKIKVKIR